MTGLRAGCRPGVGPWAALALLGVMAAIWPVFAAEQPAQAAPPAPTWSLSGQGEGISKLVTVERDGRKLQVLYANGGNTLVVARPAWSSAEAAVPQFGDRLKLQCDLLLAEYDVRSRQIERLLCAGHVQVTILAQGNSRDGQDGRESYFAAETLTFEHAAQAADRQASATRVGPLGLMNGTWTLNSARAPWPEMPAEFAQWLEQMPAVGGERVLLKSDRLTVLAPQVVFDPIAGLCTAGPDHVTGSFARSPSKWVYGPGADAGNARSTAWSDRRRTVFSCQTLRGQFTIDGRGMEPTGPSVMQGRVFVYQPAENARNGQNARTGLAELRGETITMQWPAQPDRDVGDPPTWHGYQSLTVQGGGDPPEMELRDGDLLIRGGLFEYKPKEDSGKLTPAPGQKYVLSEMSLSPPPDPNAAHPENGALGRVRLRAAALNFHLKNRNFEAVGERILENLPAEPPPTSTPPPK